MKKITKIITQTFTGLGAFACLFSSRLPASATSVQEGANAARADGMPTELIGDNGVFSRITNTVLLIVGLISVIMLVYGGLRYILSGGDSKKVTDAKNTILYAIIGLIISMLAYAIVHFVLNSVIGVGTTNYRSFINTADHTRSACSIFFAAAREAPVVVTSSTNI